MLSIKGKGYSKIYSENPFHEDPQPKAFYYPTQEKALSKEEKQLALSPKRAGSRKQLDTEDQTVEKKFLSGSHAIKPLTSVQTHLPQSPNSSNFDESWPDSERPSSPSVAGEDRGSQQSLPYASVRKHVQPTFTSRPISQGQPLFHTGEGHFSNVHSAARPHTGITDSSGERLSEMERQLFGSERGDRGKGKMVESGVKESSAAKGSVLQRYVERFRHGTPMSREERLKIEGSKKDEFWWLDSGLSTPNSTSTPKEEQGRSLPFTCQGQGTLTVENVKKRDDLDLATAQLQEKTDRILHSAGSVTSSGPVVSTEGLGSTGSDITGSSFSETAVRPTFLPREVGPSYSRRDRQVGRGGGGGGNQQGDILYKWRLQRKLETARQSPYIPSDGAADRPLKTSAERDIERRLMEFRENLLGRGSVVKTQLMQARVEKDMKQVQTMMDSAVQTSPARSPASSSVFSQPPANTPSSFTVHHKTSAPSQVGNGTSSAPPPRHHVPTKSPDERPPCDRDRIPVSTTDTDTSASSAKATPAQGQQETLPPQNMQYQQETLPPQNTQYRQFLEAERPHDSGGDSETTSSSPRQDSTVNRRTTEPQGGEASSPASSRSTDSTGHVSTALKEPAEIDHPHGDGPCTEAKPTGWAVTPGSERRKVSDGGDMSQPSEGDADSDSGSLQSGSQRDGRGRRRKGGEWGNDGGEQTTKQQQHKSKTRAAGLPSSPPTGDSNQNNNNNNNSSSRAGQADSSSSDRRLREDPGDGWGKPSHRRPPAVDAGAQMRSGGERSQRSGVMPPPQSSSSPARTPLSSAIGQVVQDRLFDMSVSVLSSVDSVSSLQPGVVSPSPGPRHTLAAAEPACDSDGEFESDPLLVVLRQQRQSHEAQLRCLDSILAERNT
ncbi:uncharacterized protein LOC143291585 [Babylonia areolata]|uniref:uncharacterized protein LOC143291585 n=1 Tax=Babylonia areolata TaxID=304850 RepID=UPI003FD6A5B8